MDCNPPPQEWQWTAKLSKARKAPLHTENTGCALQLSRPNLEASAGATCHAEGPTSISREKFPSETLESCRHSMSTIPNQMD